MSNDPMISQAACRLALAYGLGKPTERREISGPEGEAVSSQITVTRADTRMKWRGANPSGAFLKSRGPLPEGRAVRLALHRKTAGAMAR